jgi:hypothetical protein
MGVCVKFAMVWVDDLGANPQGKPNALLRAGVLG